ncbi:dual specificity protein phosphatase 22-B [Sinocyclocheilus grahami]|uniref:dual specificity protein phosphatase 22-B n=1 Tax=Sinocyclocheilus grahami TaxID=75366 RepID=UPI0007AD34E6|nr:PREDICTED: dual specificity protein phosphatase 22-B-like [Sinocyclocheilus grahami]
MGNGINKVLPDLYLGNFKDARDREQLARNNITHILSIHDTAAPILQEMTYLCIPAADSPTQNLLVFSSLAGVSRSVTLVVAYLMTVTTLGWQEALAAVKVARPCASPNMGFQKQLLEFETSQLQQVTPPRFTTGNSVALSSQTWQPYQLTWNYVSGPSK